MSFLRSKWAPVGLISAFLALAYWRVAYCGFIWDDDDYVWQNPVLRTWGGLWQIWFEPTSLPQYYPLVHTSFWLEAMVFGLPPEGATMEAADKWATGYHLVNVVLHGLSAFFLLRLGRRLCVPGILFAALWFLVHPVHVESVAWVTERKNVLSLLCYLIAAGYWLRWHDEQSNRSYWLGSLWLLGALWSKTVTASLPAALLIIVWWRDGKITKRAIGGAFLWFVVGACLGGFTVYLEATHVGAADAPWQLAGMQRLAVAGSACWFYFGSLLWPFHTCFNYLRWEVDPPSLLLWLAPVAAVLMVLGTWVMRARIGRGACAMLLLFGGTLVPAIGFFDVYPFRYSFVADHFQYHASLAVLVSVSAVGARLLPRLVSESWVVSVAGVWLCLMAYTTHGLLPQYDDFKAMWESTLEKNPRSALALVNLGSLAVNAGDVENGRDYLTRCLAIDGTSDEANLNLGVIAHQAGNVVEAKAFYMEALRLNEIDPNVRNNLAVLAIEAGDTKEAIRLAREAIQLDPNYYAAHSALGWALTDAGQWSEALKELGVVLQMTPKALESRRRVVTCLLGQNKPSNAAANALVALQLHPRDSESRYLLARALALTFQSEAAGSIREMSITAIRNGKVDPDPILPLLADELDKLGAVAQAAAIRGS